MCFVVTCWERADLLALVCGVFCEFVTFPLVSWVRCGTWLYRFLIFAPLLTFKPSSKIFYWPFHGGTSFMDLLCFCSVLCLLCLCARLFICALWSPAGKGLTSWLSFVVYNCKFVTFPLVSWVRCGTWMYRFLIFAPLLILPASDYLIRFCADHICKLFLTPLDINQNIQNVGSDLDPKTFDTLTEKLLRLYFDKCYQQTTTMINNFFACKGLNPTIFTDISTSRALIKCFFFHFCSDQSS